MSDHPNVQYLTEPEKIMTDPGPADALSEHLDRMEAELPILHAEADAISEKLREGQLAIVSLRLRNEQLERQGIKDRELISRLTATCEKYRKAQK